MPSDVSLLQTPEVVSLFSLEKSLFMNILRGRRLSARANT